MHGTMIELKLLPLLVFSLFAVARCSSEKQDFVNINNPSIDMIKLTGGPWQHAMELERDYLRSLEPERLLYYFKKNAGIETNSKEYGGWEMEWAELRGHSIGHYLSAISRMSRLANDSLLFERCKYTVTELKKCQDKIGTGFLGAWPDEYLDRADNGKKVWAPYYTLHKILAGLLDSYVYCNDQDARKMAIELSHYLYNRIAPLGDEHFQKALDKTEQGGMNEALWNMYAETGDTICRNLAVLFQQNSYLDPLLQGRDNLKNWHSNSFIPHVVGVARGFEVTGDIKYKQISQRFWEQVVNTRSFVTGGTSNGEHWFSDPYHMHLQLGPGAHECCCSYNLVKLTNHLWEWTHDVKYQDYMERALTNAILPTQNRETGMTMYYVSMAPGYYKTWGTPFHSFWCCTGSGMENFSRIAEYLYSVDNNRLFVNQFVPSEVNFQASGFKLIQETTLPKGDQLSIKIACDNPVALKLAVRIPSWTSNDYTILIDGKVTDFKPQAGSYLMLDRTWKNGDKLEITFKPQLWYSVLPITNKNVAFGYGPLVLSAKFEEPEVEERLRHMYGPYDGQPVEVPVIRVNTTNFEDYIETVDDQNYHFKVKSKTGKDILLVPFYEIHNECFSVYLPIDHIENNINVKEVDPSDHI